MPWLNRNILFFAPTIAGSFSPSSSGVNTETPYSFKGNPWSYTVGGFLGYNVQLGSYVIGAEGDVAWKNGSSGSNQFTITPASYAPLFGFGPGTTAYRAESFNGTLRQTSEFVASSACRIPVHAVDLDLRHRRHCVR